MLGYVMVVEFVNVTSADVQTLLLVEDIVKFQ